ncbi:putative hydrogenase accessory protein [Methylocaldum marinum]|uniref:Putative hydrogenase accessory protein n=1 Tax=Methylocaldum marinum TaxID=1432792 RepID=A0A250KMS7_9GAMM|nr:HupE/UreJ family protein [Methylocaldum marinum]BBA32832.1 putative hydrogenase accessory protein [Methylocaldum marinum]
MRLKYVILLLIQFLCAGQSVAHTGFHPVEGFASGFAHPLTGADHLAAMVCVGVWAALVTVEAGRLWRLPAAFMVAMMLGGALAAFGVEIAGAEPAIAASVLALGLFVLGKVRLSGALAAVIVGLFAVAHGYAHGLEMAQGAAFSAYAAGFVIATGLLHFLGIVLGRCLLRVPGLYRVAGGAVGMFGVLLLVQAW